MSLKPVILITIYRRYHELQKNLKLIREMFSEFQVKPDVVVIWAAPEICRLWFFQELLKNEEIQHLVYRPAHDLEGKGPITFLESLNLRRGLEFIKEKYSDYYVIGQACDILPKNGVYRYIDTEIQDQNIKSLLFFWSNTISNADVWHTNFFVVKDDDKYWPPVSAPYDFDVLESQWGKNLVNNRLSAFIRNHNSRNQKFDHEHESEKLPEFPKNPQHDHNFLPFYIMGYIPWYKRWYQKIIGVFKWLSL